VRDKNSVVRKAVRIDLGFRDYEEVLDLQNRLAQERFEGLIPDLLLTVEHPHTYTLGRASKEEDLLLNPEELKERGIRTFHIARGGRITYHGPGQIVGYPILDLREFGQDVHRYLRALEEVLIRTLGSFGIMADRIAGRTGVWVGRAKIAAIGVGIRRWITFHGFALNVAPDLSYFNGIIPCGIAGCQVTSMSLALGRVVETAQVLAVLANCFAETFGLEMRMESDEWLHRFAGSSEEAPLAAR